jgi:hypothetical protein
MKSYSGDKIVILEIDPADVVSIPTDYNNAKGRCCRYKVVGELTDLNKDILSGNDHVSEINVGNSAVFSFEFDQENNISENKSEEESGVTGEEVREAMLKPGKTLLFDVLPTGELIPNFKYCKYKNRKYKVAKRIDGKKYKFGTFDNISDAEDMVFKIVKAELEGKLDELIEEYFGGES